MTSRNALIPSIYHVKENKKESHDVYTLTLTPTDNKPVSFKPGQFNMLYAFGVGESAISISSNPHNPQHLQHTIRRVGSVTHNLERLKVGDPVGVRGPFGTGWPLEASKGKSILIMGGGIGIAPLRSLIYALIERRQDYLDIDVVYSVRKMGDLIFQDDFAAWQSQINLQVIIDHAPIIPDIIADPKDTVVMMCGPEAMMRFCYYTLKENNFLPEQIYLTLERNMQCAVGQCGHCQWGPFFICKDGPVMDFKTIAPYFAKYEL